MDDVGSLPHTAWQVQYHVVFMDASRDSDGQDVTSAAAYDGFGNPVSRAARWLPLCTCDLRR